MNAYAEKFVNNLISKNLNFESGTDKDGDSIVEFPYKGKVAKMFFTGEDGKYFSLYMIYERIPEEKVPALIVTCNELNAEYKWITFYVDKDNDLILHTDGILSAADADEVAFELLIRTMKIAEDLKPALMKAIYA